MEKSSRKPKFGKNNDATERRKDSDDLEDMREGHDDDSSDDDDAINFPNQPPIQNGFVVFIHQVSLNTSVKDKRTVIEWISDALKMLDIFPESISVDRLIEMSSTLVVKKDPIIKFSRPSAENVAEKSRGGQKKKKNERFAGGQGKGAKDSSKISQSSSSKSLQKRSRPGKRMEEKKQTGVQFQVLKDMVKRLQRENYHCVWVLLVESRKRCIVDMSKLNALASRFRFKIRWIAAQAPKSLDQSVFTVVNDIVQTKNICFPDQIKPNAGRRKDKDSRGGRGKHGKQTVEILHKTLSSQFEVSSHASFEMSHCIKNLPPTVAPSAEVLPPQGEPKPPDLEDLLQHNNPPIIPDPPFHPDPLTGSTKEKMDKKNSNLSQEAATLESSESSSVLEIRPSNSKNYAAMYNTTVHMALVTTDNPMAYMRNDVLALPPVKELKKNETEMSVDDGNDKDSAKETQTHGNCIVVVVRDMAGTGNGLATLLKNMLRREGIRAYTISLPKLLAQPEALKLMETFAVSGGYEPERDTKMGCKLLLQKALETRLSANKHNVIVVDVADESYVRMWSVYNFTLRLGYRGLILERKADGSFENNLKKVFQVIRRRFHKRFLYSWPSTKHSASNRSSNDFIFNPESVEKLGSHSGSFVELGAHGTSSSKGALSQIKSLRPKTRTHSSGVSFLNVEEKPSNSKGEGLLTREVKSSNFLDKIKTGQDNICETILRLAAESRKMQAELPDILGGTAAVSNVNNGNELDVKGAESGLTYSVKSETDNNNQFEGEDLLGVHVEGEEEGEEEEEDDQDEEEDQEEEDTGEENSQDSSRFTSAGEAESEGPQKEVMYDSGASQTTLKTHSMTEDSSLDSTFLDALKATMLQELPQANVKVKDEFPEGYPHDGLEDTCETDISECRPSTTKLSCRCRSPPPVLPEVESTTDEDEDKDVCGNLYNCAMVSSRTSVQKNRKNLLEIHRCKSQDDADAPHSSASEDDLFKGWVAMPGKDVVTRDPGFLKRTHARITGILHSLCRCNRKETNQGK